MKRFITWLTRPKITIFLDSGNVIRTRKKPFGDSSYDREKTITDNNYGDVISPVKKEAISVRKWYQPWA